MTFANAILAILLLLPQHKSDKGESAVDRDARLTRVADGIAAACKQVTCTDQSESCRSIYHSREECAATLAQLALVESGLAEHVMAGECKPHECDRGRAVGLWQIHRAPAWSDERWEAMRGDSAAAITAQALRVAQLIAGGVSQCGSLAGALSRYNSGNRCDAYRFEAESRRIEALAAQIRVRIAKD